MSWQTGGPIPVASDTPHPGLTLDIARSRLADGVVILTAGAFGNVMRFLPPLLIADDLLVEGLDAFEHAIAQTA
jgi:4-aminobutyrate aminotransferase/(S)-3-amino-2-methylpropionate transaminase